MDGGGNLFILGLIGVVLCVMVALCLLLPMSGEQ